MWAAGVGGGSSWTGVLAKAGLVWESGGWMDIGDGACTRGSKEVK